MKSRHVVEIKVDPCNPGQYFACCGLLAVADRLSTDVRAWFDCPRETPREGRFCITSHEALSEPLLFAFADASVTDDPVFGDTYKNPIFIETRHAGFFYLDWWLDNDYRNPNSRIKNWAGTAKMKEDRFEKWIENIAREREKHISIEEIFNCAVPGKKINIDPRSSFNGSLALGYSPKDMNIETAVYPFVEFFGAIGLQYNRPKTTRSGVYCYHVWNEPTVFGVATITTGNQSHLGSRGYFFRQEKDSELGHNTPFTFARPDGD